MAYVVFEGDREVAVDVREEEGVLRVRVGERERVLDVAELKAGMYSLLVDGRSYAVDVLEDGGSLSVVVDGQVHLVTVQTERDRRLSRGRGRGTARAGGGTVAAPMPGKVVRVLVGVGDRVEPGQGVIVVEAMKMENELEAPAGGTVREIRVQEGKTVNGGDVLVVIE